MVQSRIAPAPISRGMSVRKLPRASYDEIEGVCNHYLAKTGGAYDGPASRAVFDLAHEVKALLAPAQEEEGRRCARVRHLENLMLEWEEVFGQGSSALTPAVVVEQLRAQSAEIGQLRARLAATEEYAVAAEAEWERVLAGHPPAPPRARARPRAVRRRVVHRRRRGGRAAVARSRPAQRPARRDARPPRAAARNAGALTEIARRRYEAQAARVARPRANRRRARRSRASF